MAKLWEFLQGHPKPVFFSKVQRGDQGTFFKNRPKGSPRLKGPKPFWRKRYYPLISMLLKYKDWTRFCGKKAAPKVPEWPSYSNFRNVTHNPHSEKMQRVDQGKFSKNRPKGSPRLKGPKALWRKVTQNPHFLKSAKGGPREMFQKSPKK